MWVEVLALDQLGKMMDTPFKILQIFHLPRNLRIVERAKKYGNGFLQSSYLTSKMLRNGTFECSFFLIQ